MTNEATNETTRFDLPLALLKIGAVRLSPDAPFTWASGRRAPVYCDNRQLLGFPDARAEIAGALADAVRGRGADALVPCGAAPDLIAGTSTAGIPWAAWVAERLGLPLVYVRPEPKKHGMARQVEGPLSHGRSVVLIEDLISTGGSCLKCVEARRREGARVLEVLALVSYGLPEARAAFADAGVEWRTLASFADLVDRAASSGLVTKEGAETLERWGAENRD
jgi:orotate phosphoribosyltransferase